MILSYYSVIGGWILKYFFSYLTTLQAPADFNAFIESSWEPIVWHGIFMFLTIAICLYGIKGIEKASTFMMPMLFVLLIIVIVRSVTLPGASEGLAFIFKPNMESFHLESINAALGQVFYSLSLCMGITVTYGSYLNKKESIPGSCIKVAVLDTMVAILAGIAIFPAVFAFGLEPGQGPGLIFGTLPKVFSSYHRRRIFCHRIFRFGFSRSSDKCDCSFGGIGLLCAGEMEIWTKKDSNCDRSFNFPDRNPKRFIFWSTWRCDDLKLQRV